MRVVLEIPSGLARFASGQSSLELEGQTIEDLFDRLWQVHPELRSRILDEQGQLYPYLAVIHNRERLTHKGLDRLKLQDGDTLEIMTLASGG